LSSIREALEERERDTLAPQAAKSSESKGRLTSEPEDDVRPAFQHDRDRIIHSKAFRRLKHKTQVFFAPEGDHYRTRLTHTLEVSQIARQLGLLLTGGSDFHGDPAHGRTPGAVTLPAAEFARLREARPHAVD
jgi:dGTPase